MNDILTRLLDSLIASGPLAAILGIAAYKIWMAYQGLISQLLTITQQQNILMAETRDALRSNAVAQHRVADVIDKCEGKKR